MTNANWKSVKFRQLPLSFKDKETIREIEYCDDPKIVNDYLAQFRGEQDSIDETPEKFYPSALPEEERLGFSESDKAERLYKILTSDDSKYQEKQRALDWLLTYGHELAIDWFHQDFQNNLSRYMGYRPVPSDRKFHELLASNEKSQEVLANEVRKKVESNGYSGNHAELLKKAAPDRFLDFCEVELTRNPRAWYANQIAKARPHGGLLAFIADGMQKAPNDAWSAPLTSLLQNESSRSSALKFIETSSPKEPGIRWWTMVGRYGEASQRAVAIEELSKLELSASKCEALYELDEAIGLAEYDQYVKTLTYDQRRRFGQMTYYPYECYYGMKLEPDQLAFILWTIRVCLWDSAVESLCEAWRGSEGDQKAAEDLGPTLLATLNKSGHDGNLDLTITNAIGQIYRGSQNETVVKALVEASKNLLANLEKKTTALECFARNLQLVGGDRANAAAKLFWNQIESSELLKYSFPCWFDKQWCDHQISVQSLLDELDRIGYPVSDTPEELYLHAWEEFNDRRQSAPSLGVFPQGYFESVIWALDDSKIGSFVYDELEDIMEALPRLAQNDFSVQGLTLEKGGSQQTVKFVCNGRLINYRSKQVSIEIEEAVDLANQVLLLDRDPLEKQFVVLPESDDSRICVLFGPTELLQKLIEDFFLIPTTAESR
jgi:hypothetical protein